MTTSQIRATLTDRAVSTPAWLSPSRQPVGGFYDAFRDRFNDLAMMLVSSYMNEDEDYFDSCLYDIANLVRRFEGPSETADSIMHGELCELAAFYEGDELSLADGWDVEAVNQILVSRGTIRDQGPVWS